MTRFTMEETIYNLFKSAIDHYVIAREHVAAMIEWAKKYDVEKFRSNCPKCSGNGIYFNHDWAPCSGEAFWSGNVGRWFACPDCAFGQALKRLEIQVLNVIKREPNHKKRMLDTMVRCEAAFEAAYNQKHRPYDVVSLPKPRQKRSVWNKAVAVFTEGKSDG